MNDGARIDKLYISEVLPKFDDHEREGGVIALMKSSKQFKSSSNPSICITAVLFQEITDVC